MDVDAPNPALPCASKNSYGDEDFARTVGRRASSERGVALWVYRCTFCTWWHLTKQDCGPSSAVSAPFSTFDDFIHIPGDGPFWNRVANLPLTECVISLQVLYDRLFEERKRYRHSGGEDKLRIESLNEMVRKANLERHLKENVLRTYNWYEATRIVLGEDAKVRFQVAMAHTLHAEQLHEDCGARVRYRTEIEARTEGKARAVQECRDLWVFPCAMCSGWHVTAKKRAPYWHIKTDVGMLDTYADLLGDAHFWNRLVDMPRHEMEENIREVIQKVSVRLHETTGRERSRLEGLLSRLKSEVSMLYGHYRSHIPTQSIFVATFGLEAFERMRPVLLSLAAVTRPKNNAGQL